MTSQGHNGCLLRALWCYNSGCTQWEHSEGRAAAIKTWTVAYCAVRQPFKCDTIIEPGLFHSGRPGTGAIKGATYWRESEGISNRRVKMLGGKLETQNYQTLLEHLYFMTWLFHWIASVRFLILFPPHKICTQEKFCHNLLLPPEVRFLTVLNKDQLHCYLKLKSLTRMSLFTLFYLQVNCAAFWCRLYLNACRFPEFKFAVCISVLCWTMSGLC